MSSLFVFFAILITDPIRTIEVRQAKYAAVQYQLSVEFLSNVLNSAYDATYGYGHHV